MASKAAPKKPLSGPAIKRIADQVEAEVAQERKKREKSGETFVTPTREQLEETLRRTNTPFFSFESWNNTAPPGGAINYTVGVHNPDPVVQGGLAVAVSIGNRSPIVSNDLFLSDFDRRFATLAAPPTLGFSLAPGTSTSLAFTVRIPAGIEKTGYFGNTVLQRLGFFGVSTLIARAMFFFGVV